MKTLTVSQLIKNLKQIEKEGYGDRPVYLSSDPEGNSYGSIDAQQSVAYDADVPTKIVIYPFEQDADLFTPSDAELDAWAKANGYDLPPKAN